MSDVMGLNTELLSTKTYEIVDKALHAVPGHEGLSADRKKLLTTRTRPKRVRSKPLTKLRSVLLEGLSVNKLEPFNSVIDLTNKVGITRLIFVRLYIAVLLDGYLRINYGGYISAPRPIGAVLPPSSLLDGMIRVFLLYLLINSLLPLLTNILLSYVFRKESEGTRMNLLLRDYLANENRTRHHLSELLTLGMYGTTAIYGGKARHYYHLTPEHVQEIILYYPTGKIEKTSYLHFMTRYFATLLSTHGVTVSNKLNGGTNPVHNYLREFIDYYYSIYAMKEKTPFIENILQTLVKEGELLDYEINPNKVGVDLKYYDMLAVQDGSDQEIKYIGMDRTAINVILLTEFQGHTESAIDEYVRLVLGRDGDIMCNDESTPKS